MQLFTDGSVHPQSKVGYGAYLIAEADADPAGLKDKIQVRRFENTSSTRLELETLIWALQQLRPDEIEIYSDSQNIIGLPGRRIRLEQRQYCSTGGIPLKNAVLYQEFFRITDQFNCTFIKVKGHRKTKEKSRIDQLFTLVDRASRSALRAAIR